MNIVLAAGIAHGLGMSPKAIEAGIGSMPRVPGRLERVPNDAGITCLVDYAHTDDALRNVLTTLREIATGRIITVFGCGGDRDRGKRPLMGEAAATLSDLSVITSDNPRTEDATAIIADILPGAELSGKPRIEAGRLAGASTGYAVIPDRREAVATAIRAALPGDVVLIAGKGHEDYQIIGTQKQHFDDREEALRVLAAYAGGGVSRGDGATEC
jgi:UDP-N-acetylmuramoyl-L-alanyl-D-glutamate--2,6-diaminopimelate ligase